MHAVPGGPVPRWRRGRGTRAGPGHLPANPRRVRRLRRLCLEMKLKKKKQDPHVGQWGSSGVDFEQTCTKTATLS